MNVLSELKTEGLRSVFTFLVPGGTAIAPWVCVLVHYYPRLNVYADAHSLLAAVVLLLASLTAGKFVDGLGSWWEVGVNNRLLKKRSEFQSFDDDWRQYLRMAFPTEPVGVRYIRDLKQSLKFELNQGIALLVLWSGICGIAFVKESVTLCHALLALIPVAAVSGFLLWDSYFSSQNLAEVRQALVKGVIVSGSHN